MIKDRMGFSSFLSFFLLISLFFSVTVRSDPLLWQAVHPKYSGKVYLFGSIHVGRAAMYPLPKVVVDAFDSSDSLMVEVDVGSEASERVSQLVARVGFDHSGLSLKQRLPEFLWLRLKFIAEKNLLQLQQFQNMQPWLVSMQLVLHQAKKAGYKDEFGVDQYFISRARGVKPILPMETLHEQFSLFERLTDREQIELLTKTLDEFARGDSFLVLLMKAWLEGDENLLESLALSPLRFDVSDRFYQLLIVDRNLRMKNKIVGEVRRGQHVFVVVGAGHLLGPDSIGSLLQAEGYLLKQLSAKKVGNTVEPI